MCEVIITTINGNVIKELCGEENRCDNCGKLISQAKEMITGGMITEGEWACCEECSDEMVEKGCCFEELGENIYRQQKY